MKSSESKTKRDSYIDFLRSFSLIIVVIWHWAFSVLKITPETISPSNPIGQVGGMWAATWVLQVMPIFFFVGGYAHKNAFNKHSDSKLKFLSTRYKRLLIPSLLLVGIWFGLGFTLKQFIVGDWVWSGVILVLSPLWFLIVYLVLVTLTPLAISAHTRWNGIEIVWLVGIAAVFDVLRFSHGIGWAAWLNFLVIWSLAHQLGFYYEYLVMQGKRLGWMLLWSGLFGLIALTNIGFYPRSVVGVPGERFSNMGPPTLAIVALIFLQIGIVLVCREWTLNKLETSSVWQKMFSWVNQNSLILYLFHTSGMAIVLAFLYLVFDYLPPEEPNLQWWLTRPVWIVLPAIATYPLIGFFRKITTKESATETLETA